MVSFVEQIKHSTKLRWTKVYKFQTKIPIFIEAGPYIVKTAESLPELLSCFKLRFNVFSNEFRNIQGSGFDFDKFDYYFDHLIILKKETNQVIGTYRIGNSQLFKTSYTELEFDLSHIKKVNPFFLELGRACIDKNYRKGAIITLLWRGIAEYMKYSQASMLLGCSSIKVQTALEAALIYKYLIEEQYVDQEISSSPTKKFAFKDFEIWFSYFRNNLSQAQRNQAEMLIPPLLKSYLKSGAKIASIPAYDENFECSDLLTVLKRENISNSRIEKFKVN